MTDEQLRSDAQDELLWEPKVDNTAIAVSAHDGVVTLRGTVGSFRERREAVNAVKRVAAPGGGRRAESAAQRGPPRDADLAARPRRLARCARAVSIEAKVDDRW
jgi:hypothetical protein